ncbi:hypothetical protein D3C72_1761190 [compost metagenome]
MRQGFFTLRQPGEHPFPSGDISATAIGRNGVDPQRIERMAFRRDQVPAAVTFFGAEEALGGKTRPLDPTTKRVQGLLGTFGQPGFELLLFLAGLRLKLFVAGNFLRPIAA